MTSLYIVTPVKTSLILRAADNCCRVSPPCFIYFAIPLAKDQSAFLTVILNNTPPRSRAFVMRGNLLA